MDFELHEMWMHQMIQPLDMMALKKTYMTQVQCSKRWQENDFDLTHSCVMISYATTIYCCHSMLTLSLSDLLDSITLVKLFDPKLDLLVSVCFVAPVCCPVLAALLLLSCSLCLLTVLQRASFSWPAAAVYERTIIILWSLSHARVASPPALLYFEAFNTCLLCLHALLLLLISALGKDRLSSMHKIWILVIIQF